jgi:hypothetical protein
MMESVACCHYTNPASISFGRGGFVLVYEDMSCPAGVKLVAEAKGKGLGLLLECAHECRAYRAIDG